MRKLMLALMLTSGLAFAAPASAATEVIAVNGNANPFLAGKLAGTPCCLGDSAPAQSPAQILSGLTAGNILTFSATGATNNSGASNPVGNADGATNFGRFDMLATYGTGISGARGIELNALVGVFLDANDPGTTAPAALNFSGGLNFASLSPGLRQIFWIGDGFTGTGSGAVQQFFVPTGASRLFLGSTDLFGWYNNSGTFTVTINGVNGSGGGGGGVPEPATWAMMITGFGLAGATLRRRRAMQTA